MTYREKLQKIAADLDNINCEISRLRDYTDPDLKKYLNDAKSHTLDAILKLSSLDNMLNDNHAKETV